MVAESKRPWNVEFFHQCTYRLVRPFVVDVPKGRCAVGQIPRDYHKVGSCCLDNVYNGVNTLSVGRMSKSAAHNVQI